MSTLCHQQKLFSVFFKTSDNPMSGVYNLYAIHLLWVAEDITHEDTNQGATTPPGNFHPIINILLRYTLEI